MVPLLRDKGFFLCNEHNPHNSCYMIFSGIVSSFSKKLSVKFEQAIIFQRNTKITTKNTFQDTL